MGYPPLKTICGPTRKLDQVSGYTIQAPSGNQTWYWKNLEVNRGSMRQSINGGFSILISSLPKGLPISPPFQKHDSSSHPHFQRHFFVVFPFESRLCFSVRFSHETRTFFKVPRNPQRCSHDIAFRSLVNRDVSSSPPGTKTTQAGCVNMAIQNGTANRWK